MNPSKIREKFGDDTYVWGLDRDGDDFFSGGEGNDTVKLDLGNNNTTIQEAYEAGAFDITVMDAKGKPVEITDDMWNSDGNLTLPDEAMGTITAAGGNTMTFSGVEAIEKFNW